MSSAYRVEREQMVRGQETALYRVVVRLRKNTYGTVQTGLLYDDAHQLCERLQLNEATQRARQLPGGFKR
jgi:hypothetical protein